jgi:hypothetical protein
VNRRRVIAAALTVAALLAVAGAGSVVVPGRQAYDHLYSAVRLAGRLQTELTSGEVDQARQTVAAVQEHARAARAATTSPGWRLGRWLPGLGRNLSAVDAVTAAVDQLAHAGLPPLVDTAGEVRPAALVPRDGRMELAPLRQAAPKLAAADEAVRQARDRVAAIDTGGLLPPVRSAIATLRQHLDQAVGQTATVARTAALLPSMLGADGPRTYLVMFQNPAEVRATGGMPGAFAVVRADQGRLRLVDQGTAGADLKSFEEPVLPLEPALLALYTDRLARYPANVNLTPHFPTAARLAREMYRLRSGVTVDGVLATDPVALSYLLRATGPITPPGGSQLTADNVVRVLLSDVYAQIESAQAQDAFFTAAATTAFEEMVSGGLNPRTALTELARAAGERRILLWSAHEPEQRLIAGTVLGGELPTDDGARPTVGVFLNDGSGAKLGYYLRQSARVSAVSARPDGRWELRLRVSLHSTAPPTGLPPSVLGLGLAGDPYTVRTNVSIASPAGGALVEVRRDGEPAAVGTGTERRRATGVLTVDLPPGATATLDATLLTGVIPADEPPSTDAVRLWLTPAVTPWQL